MDATVSTPVTGPGSRYLLAYQSSGRSGPAALSALLPPRTDPDYLWVLTELVRADLESQGAAGGRVRLEPYRQQFPELFADPVAARAVAAEERRLRELAGDWFHQDTPFVVVTPAPVGQIELTRAVPIAPLTSLCPEGPLTDRATASVPLVVDPPTRVRPEPPTRGRFPRVGDTFVGFRLTAELGTGAFAKVFLAEQVALSNRPMALKVTTRPTREPQQLAKLRHTNVVPIYSVHDEPPLQAVCMPYLGRHTLADVVREYRSTGLFFGTVAHSASTLAAGKAAASTQTSVPPPSSLPAPADPEPALPMPPALAGLTHPDMVLWLVARLTDGLAHAHETGILHLDIKPANVLVADDGHPLLLDFNLAFDLNAGDRERAGGTLPYMAPEQLDEYQVRGSARLDHRTDLYALGVLFFELLTGEHPFPTAAGGRPHPAAMAKARRAGTRSPRSVNPTVPPAVDAVVRKLLQPDPAKRYQSARDLLTDLERQQNHLPLKFAADRSVVERVRKWRKRNPRAAVYAALAAAVLAACGAATAANRHAEARATDEAVARAHKVRGEIGTLRADLISRGYPKSREAALERGRDLFASYGLPSENWAENPAARALPPATRQQLADDLGELALLMAHAEWLNGRKGTPDAQAGAAGRGLQWNKVADACYAGRPAPAAVAAQRKRLAAIAAKSPTPKVEPAGDAPIDLFLCGAERIADGRFREAIPPLEELTGRDPTHAAGQFALGICRHEMGDKQNARERYHVAKALAPSDYRPSYNRGIVNFFHGHLREAEADFTDALRRDDAHADSYLHRALVRGFLNNQKGAVADLTKALDCGASPLQVYSLRADAREKLGDKAAARQDREASEREAPAEPMDYVVRGLSRLRTNSAGALADFVKAAELDPTYLPAWQNQAHVLADHLDQPVKALEASNRAVEVYPQFAPARAGRAVLHARLGDRAKARDDAEQAMQLSGEPMILYQAACAYALTAKKHPEDAKDAIDCLRRAFRDGFRDFKLVAEDTDLDAVRKLPAFEEVVRAAKSLSK